MLSSCRKAQNLITDELALFYKVTSNHFNNFKFPEERNSYYENIMFSHKCDLKHLDPCSIALFCLRCFNVHVTSVNRQHPISTLHTEIHPISRQRGPFFQEYCRQWLTPSEVCSRKWWFYILVKELDEPLSFTSTSTATAIATTHTKNEELVLHLHKCTPFPATASRNLRG